MPVWAMLMAHFLAFTENSQKCVTFGYYIIARFASWGPSVPLGGFRPPGIGGCSLTMEQKRVGHVHNGTSYNNLYLIAFGTTGAIKIKRQEIGDSYSAIRYSLSWFPVFVKHIWHFFRCLLFLIKIKKIKSEPKNVFKA